MLPDGNKGRDKSPTRYIPNMMERLGLYKPPPRPLLLSFVLWFWPACSLATLVSGGSMDYCMFMT